jgi:hypothetical protein
LTADTVLLGKDNSQAYDRYAYVMNSPLKLVDPTGHSGRIPCIPGSTCPGDVIWTYPNNDFESFFEMGTDLVCGITGSCHVDIEQNQVIADPVQISVLFADVQFPNLTTAISLAESNVSGGTTTLYHGSIDNASGILENGFDIYREGATYVSPDIRAAQDAINYRMQNFPDEVTDPGIITSTVPTNEFQGLQQSGDILGKPYNGFFGSTLNTTEYLLKTPAAKDLFNRGMIKD